MFGLEGTGIQGMTERSALSCVGALSRRRHPMRLESSLRWTALGTGLALVLALLAASAPAAAAEGWVALEKPKTQAQSTRDYWTPERMRDARPMPLPRHSGGATANAGPVQAQGAPRGADGAPPTAAGIQAGREMSRQLFEDDAEFAAARAELEAYDAIEGNNVGTLGAHFSSSRVFPD